MHRKYGYQFLKEEFKFEEMLVKRLVCSRPISIEDVLSDITGPKVKINLTKFT